jgi:RNA polymerase sigma-70 factor (ECF subfamily)
MRVRETKRGGMSSTEPSLCRLLARIAEDDPEAMVELFEQQRGPLMRLFYGLCRCPATSEDLVQATFVALWRYRRNFSGDGSASAYLYRVAVNQWRRANARERRTKESFQEFAASRVRDLATEPEDPVARDETKTAVWQAIEELPSAQRETFVLHRFEGLSCPQIAETTGKPVKTIESRLRLALEKLTEKLQKRENLS